MKARRSFLAMALVGAVGVPLMMTACGSAEEANEEPATTAAAEVVAPTPAQGSTRRRAGVRWKTDARKIDKLPSCTSPKLAYFGGPIIQDPVVVPVFWSSRGPTRRSSRTWRPSTRTSCRRATAVAARVRHGERLRGTGQVILPGSPPTGSFASGVTLKPSKCGTSSTCTLTDAQLQTELNAQIKAGSLPAPVLDCTGNTNTIYMVHFPPNVTLDGPDGSGTSCVQFCGYHNTGTISSGSASGSALLYAALMDDYSGGCADGCGVNPAANGFTAAFNNQTSIASHELAEATTDPDIGLLPASATQIAAPVGWYDENNQCGEIGDICDDGATAGPQIKGATATWTVQYLWSNKQNKCVASGTVEAICSGSTTSGCRECSCADNGVDCPSGTTCGGGGTTGACGGSSCTPLKACPSPDNCGTISDGCTGTLNCGTCSGTQTCGGGGTPNVCGSTTTCLTSCPAPDNCGTISNNCGGTLNCGTCSGTQTCGGGGTPNVCGSSTTCLSTCPSPDNCGVISNNCGGMLDCGTCSGTQTCGGGGTANVCGSSTTCLSTCPSPDNCGVISNNCGGMLDCGTCASGQTCTGNVCVGACVPLAACAANQVCGNINDGCGGAVLCGFCPSGQTCTATNTCEASASTSSSGGGGGGTGGQTASSSSTGTSTGSSGSHAASSSSSSGGDGNGGSISFTTGSGASSAANTSTTASGATTTSSSGLFATPANSNGCGCKVAGEPSEEPAPALLGFAMVALAGIARSKRRRRANAVE